MAQDASTTVGARALTGREPKISGELRAHLEWSWNYSMAEGLIEDSTVKELARSISDGISRGEEQDNNTLLEDFLSVRTDAESNGEDGKWAEGCTIDNEWLPDDSKLVEELVEALKKVTL